MGELVPPVKHSAATTHYDHSKSGQKRLQVLVDEHGNINFDAIVEQHENATKTLYSHQHMEEEETTKAALKKIVNKRLPNSVPLQSKFIKYKPSAAAFNERIIRMVEMRVDPLNPPKLKHKRIPEAYGSPPVVAVMHSPPRPVTVKDQQDWKIPPCISKWKNPKGYTMIPRLMTADGRVVQIINDNFAKLSESLYVSEEKAREAVAMRSKVQKEMMTKEEERKKMDLRALAQSARSMETKEEREREKIREERRRERGTKRRQEAKNVAMGGKKSKISSDKDGDVSEKVALGMASLNSGREVMYDQRLFNQEKGIDSGFATDDQYNVYHNGLFFTAQTTLYRPKRDTDSDMYGGVDEHLDKIMKTHLAGTSPVEFEKQVEEADPFGLDQFFTKLLLDSEGGFFNVIMTFPSNYSNSLPTVRFTSELWHPNGQCILNPDSKVCISILHPPGDDPNGYELASERWTPVHTVDSIVLSIISMLLSPNDESANVEAANGEREREEKTTSRRKSADA